MKVLAAFTPPHVRIYHAAYADGPCILYEIAQTRRNLAILKEYTQRGSIILLAECEMRIGLEHMAMPGDRFGDRLVRHAKMLGDAGKRQTKLM